MTPIQTTTPSAIGTVLADLSALLKRIGMNHKATVALVAIGLLASFAETAGITFVLLFLYLVSGQLEQAVAGAGQFGQLLRHLADASGSITMVGVLLVGLIVARALLAMAYSLLSTRTGEWTSQQLRDLIHHQYLTAPYGYVSGIDAGYRLDLLGAESWAAANAYHSATRLCINACSIAVFGLFLLVVSWKILLIAGLGGVLMVLVLRVFSRRARIWGEQVRSSHKRLGSLMLTTIEGLRTLRAFGVEPAHHERFVANSAEASEGVFRLTRMSAWTGPFSEAWYLAMLGLIMASMNFWGTTFPTVLTAVALLYRLQPHTREFEQHLLMIAHGGPRITSVREMIGKLDAMEVSQGTEEASFASEIAFRNVGFRYAPGDPVVLKGVSFTIPAGKTTALVGSSGSGKTTIVQILLRLWDIETGSVRVDGRELQSLRRESWLALVGAAGQDIDIVEATVLENLRLGTPHASDDDAVAAARAAGVDLFVESLPEQYRTPMMLEGQRFSGGQRQRIALARALLRNPDLLILDEAMNALDVELERRINAAIAERMAGHTTLVITHRLENIRAADHIVWIENGAIIGEGPPEAFADTLFARFAGDLT